MKASIFNSQMLNPWQEGKMTTFHQSAHTSFGRKEDHCIHIEFTSGCSIPGTLTLAVSVLVQTFWSLQSLRETRSCVVQIATGKSTQQNCLLHIYIHIFHMHARTHAGTHRTRNAQTFAFTKPHMCFHILALLNSFSDVSGSWMKYYVYNVPDYHTDLQG